MPPPRARQGTVLIMVAGVSALMASLALTFLVRMRSDVEESLTLMREAQAHIMLVAACNYLQEAARLGYDYSSSPPPGSPSAPASALPLPPAGFHREAYGWIDIRDGAVGPKATAISSNPLIPGDPDSRLQYGVDDDSAFPQQSVRRFDLYLKQVAPYAISPDAAPNAIDPSDGVPWLVEKDPKPQMAGSFATFERGDPTPRQNSTGRSWFRLLRCGRGPNVNLARYNAATFIVTCGGGETRGFRSRDWATMTPDDRALFSNDQTYLAALEANEIRLWYLVEWSPAVGGLHQFNLVHHRGATTDADNDNYTFNQYSQFPPNYSFYSHSQTKERNFGGTIRYVQRLNFEPTKW
ncbi:MAG TPA: hypothetical protein VHX44_09020 [Planctomycetota bacterium]|nr:hypothetical protein [Planctomycetota bacterium]